MKKRNKKDTGPREDLTGTRFGKLIVVELAGKKEYPSGDSKYLWKCVCDCGNECTPTGNALKNANTATCRKCIAEDLTGNVFGKLTVVSRVEGATNQSTGKPVVMWNCSCSCGNVHTVSSGNLNRGNVKSCGCLFDDVQAEDFKARVVKFLEKTKGLFLDKYTYDMATFVNTNSYIKITCPVHGVFTQRVTDHLESKTGCPSCSFETVGIGQAEFLRRAILAHGNKYDYSEVDFKTTAGRVKISCPEHGVFEQIAKSHMDGHECFECSMASKHWVYKVRCDNDPEFAKKDGNLYLLRMHLDGEVFLKVGVTINMQNRASHYRKANIKVDPLAIIPLSAADSADEEIKLLKFIKTNGYKYIPSSKFAGWTECANEEYEDILISYFDKLEEYYSNLEV